MTGIKSEYEYLEEEIKSCTTSISEYGKIITSKKSE